MKHIFLLEDDETLARGIAMALEGPERTVQGAGTLQQAEICLMERRFDLLILDLNLPDGNGLTLLRQLRQRGDAVPVILLTANDLEAGADDYITKPFSLAVLRARVNAQLRRGTPSAAGALVLGPFVFNFDRMEFHCHGKAVELSKTEQKLLRVLVENRGHTMPRALLVDRVWTDGAEFVENALSVTVKRLRGKLEEDPSKPEYLKTVYGIGYTWAVGP